MGLFKSAEQRRIERDLKIRQGIRRIERAIREQARFQEEFIRNARRAREIGDESQYRFIRNSLRKTATVKRVLERQLLAVRNALLVKRQAEASADFAQAMSLMAREIGRLFGQVDVERTQAEWEKALLQSQSLEERMSLFLEAVESMAAEDAAAGGEGLVSDEEIDRMIEAEAAAEDARERARLEALRAELESLRREGEKQGQGGG